MRAATLILGYWSAPALPKDGERLEKAEVAVQTAEIRRHKTARNREKSGVEINSKAYKFQKVGCDCRGSAQKYGFFLRGNDEE